MSTSIRRWVETDTGHRVPNHKSKCRNFHGHRYRWIAELSGNIITQEGSSDEGMIIDFGDISKILQIHIHDVVDHAFIVYEEDNVAIEALSLLGEHHKTLIVPFIPTAENLAKWAYEQVQTQIVDVYGNDLKLMSFEVRETPKSWASWTP